MNVNLLIRPLLLLLGVTLTSALLAQTGSIRGRITETFAGNSEPVIGAIVNVEGSTLATTTDTAGHFFIEKVPVGTYDVRITYVGYTPKVVRGVEVKEGQTANLPHLRIEEDAKTTEEVEVIGTRDKGTDASLIQEIKTLDVLASGISNEQIKRTMDRDAADVARRVSGVSVVDNRFVVVRGLSERYNAVMLNDVLAPSFEQDVKSFSLDNIASQYIDRMVVYKSPSADLPGDFVGGVVKIYTSGMPMKNNFSVNFSSSYRQGTTFEDFKLMKQGKNGWLGYDDGTYGFPKSLPPDYNTGIGSTKYDAIKVGSLFRSDTWAPIESKANPDVRFNLNGGYRLKLGGDKLLGIVSGINYSNLYQKWYDARQSLFVAPQGSADQDNIAFNYASILDNQTKTVRLNFLQNFILQLNSKNSIEFKNLYTHMGISRYRNAYSISVNNPNDVVTNPERVTTISDVNIANTYGGIISSQAAGKHSLFLNTDMNWSLGYSNATRDEPDFKNFKNRYSPKDGYKFEGTTDQPSPVNFGRLFYKTEEYVKTAAMDIAHKRIFDMAGSNEVLIKGGMYLEDKQRSFGARTFAYSPKLLDPSGNYYNDADMSRVSPNDYNDPAYWNNYNGLVMSPGGRDGSYLATTDLYAFFGMMKWSWRDKLNIVGGMRLENYTRIIDGNKLFAQNWLPSVNASYNFSKKILLRGSFGKTVNRPELREAAALETYDYYWRTFVAGNTKLKPTTVNNFDLRLEYYPNPDEAISVGVFYKEFRNPIERILINTDGGYPVISSYDVTYINANRGYSRGLELEARKSLRNLLVINNRDLFQHFSFLVNAALLESKIVYVPSELPNSGAQGFETGGDQSTRNLNIEDFLAVNSKRSLIGQSPYMVNAGVTYANEKSNTTVNLSYNVFGKRLLVVIPGLGTIYEVPRHVLDLTVSQSITKNIEIKLGVQDLINQKVQFVQDINNDGKVKRMAGSGYETDPSKPNTISTAQEGLNVSKKDIVPGDTEFLGYRRGRYYTLGVTFKF